MAGQSRVSDFQVDDHAFIAGLRSEMQKLKLKTENDLVTVALDVERRAKQLCPVKTGRLRASITHSSGRDMRGPYAEVGTSVSYAGFVEFGTSRQAPQPFLRPAFAEAVMHAASRFR